jgi:hypothetical protein
MVMVCEGKARIVISAFFEKVESGAMVVVETAAGLQRFAIDALSRYGTLTGIRSL